jgi:glycosyltransferase involved in cell wall biosynthesis
MTPILFVCSELQRGGAERQWAHLVPALRERGLDARVLALRDTGPFYDELAAAGAPVACAGMTSRFDVRGLRRAFAAAGRPALVVSQGTNALVVGEAIATRSRTRHVAIEHTPPGLQRRRHQRLLTHTLSRTVDRLVAVSESQVTELERLGYRAAQITVIRNGVPTPAATRSLDEVRDALGVAAANVVVLLVATLRPQKNVPLFLAAVERAHADEAAIRGFVAGGGPLLQETRALAGSGGAMSVLGERADVPDLLAAADIVCLSSHTEATPMVLLEAMAHGKPIVATNVGGNAEIVVDGETGVLVPPGDVDEFAAALVGLARDPAARQALGARARARHEELFSLERMVNDYHSLIERELSVNR